MWLSLGTSMLMMLGWLWRITMAVCCWIIKKVPGSSFPVGSVNEGCSWGCEFLSKGRVEGLHFGGDSLDTVLDRCWMKRRTYQKLDLLLLKLVVWSPGCNDLRSTGLECLQHCSTNVGSTQQQAKFVHAIEVWRAEPA